MSKKKLWLYMGILIFCLMALGCVVRGGVGVPIYHHPHQWHCYHNAGQDYPSGADGRGGREIEQISATTSRYRTGEEKSS